MPIILSHTVRHYFTVNLFLPQAHKLPEGLFPTASKHKVRAGTSQRAPYIMVVETRGHHVGLTVADMASLR